MRSVSYGGDTPHARIYERLRKRAWRRGRFLSRKYHYGGMKSELRRHYLAGVRDALNAAQEET